MDLYQIIKNKKVEHLYQPIVKINSGSIYGYEALIRFPEYPELIIEDIFQMARSLNLLFELDTLSIHHALKMFPFHLTETEHIFINIFPSTIIHAKFEGFLKRLVCRFPQIKGRIVFELNEAIEENHLWDVKKLKKKIDTIKECGCFIALDDIGKGAATIQKIVEFKPDYMKLDRYFAEDLSKSKEKQLIISLLVKYCKGRMGLILEGLEFESDLEIAKHLQVPIGQGYIIGIPGKITVKTFSEKQRLERKL
ncbi:EAL domain-containing protein [Sutcliffiella halmapala]|uniref:EAL domain-containing protein n=1 Tax=Sutcliffiella halmapala TaxID=79882 RepID=UPI000994F453|nr:EAL domain-containing protein [Sutcliffiella halmapala]